MIATGRKVAFYTLGCKLNFSETSTVARQFEEGGFVRAAKGEQADICVINTCSVTEQADKKCRNMVRRVIHENPGSIVVVTGCYAQLKPEAIAAIEGVDLVIGNKDKGSIFGRVAEMSKSTRASIHTCEAHELTGFFSSFSSSDRTRTYLKVQDGCDYKCSYCTIPLARGLSRNIPVSQVIAEAEKIAALNHKEIVLTGINTGDFGKTTGEKFIDLLSALENVAGIERYRISSIEPNLLTDEIIEFTARSGKFQPHFHIPLQSGCDRVLAKMGRRYDTAFFAGRIETVRRLIPNAFIGIDVIVGFPGETEEDFRTTYGFLESIAPAFLHVFPYSSRPGTPAAGLENKVPPPLTAGRVKRLTELSDRLHESFCRKYFGTAAKVLWENTRKNGEMFGYTENYIKVSAPYDKTSVNIVTDAILGYEICGGAVKSVITGNVIEQLNR